MLFLIASKYHALHQMLLQVNIKAPEMKDLLKQFDKQNDYEYSYTGFMGYLKEQHNIDSYIVEPYPVKM